ncbi:ArnT family glycosyltransferase [Streptacidiphilus sp. PAMC 29251]
MLARRGERWPTQESRPPRRNTITTAQNDTAQNDDAQNDDAAQPLPVPPVPPAPLRTPLRQRLWQRLRAACTLPRLLLVLIAAAAAGAYAWSLSTEGLEAYYAAGVRSMSSNWHDFFYDAFDPHGTITLDKLPGAFWIQALSVRVFGYAAWSMVLPQVVESTLTVLVLYRAVRRTSGTGAALVAAAVLAASPVTIASTRGNLSEPLFLLCLVLAADAVLRVVVDNRRRSAYAAAFWVALAFQAKMTEAWLVLPALVIALLAGSGAVGRSERVRALLRAGAVALLAVALSLTWVCAFALTPASSRPVVDGSAHNSIVEQVFRYNGSLRFGDGDGDSGSDSGSQFGLKPLGTPSPEALKIAAQNWEPAYGAGMYPPSTFSKAGWDRLFVGVLAPDTAWFLPCAVLGAAVLLRVRRRAGRGDPLRAGTLLWTSWLLLYGVAFSSAGVIHDYYLATLVPAIAALSGMGLAVLWKAARSGRRRAVVVLAVLAITQGASTAVLLMKSHNTFLVMALGVCTVLATAAAAVLPGRLRTARPLVAGLAAAVALAAALIGPLAASGWLLERGGGPFDTAFASVGTFAQPTPAARIARSKIRGGYGGVILPTMSAALWSRLRVAGQKIQQETDSDHREMLVFGSSQASNYVVEGVSSIQPIGGFTGDVPYPSVAQVTQLIKQGKVSWAVLPGADTLVGNDPRVRAIESLCRKDPLVATPDQLLYFCGP